MDWLKQILLSGISPGEWRDDQQREVEVPQSSMKSVASQKQHVSQSRWQPEKHRPESRKTEQNLSQEKQAPGKEVHGLPPTPESPVSRTSSFARLAGGGWFTAVSLAR